MRQECSLDEDLVRRLPLPLAQLYRRAHNAKTPLERHLTAYYLWEAALKLLASVAIVRYAEQPAPDPQLTERLQSLARPALGHWWEFVRRLVPVLADQGDEGFVHVRDVVLGRARDDCPRVAGLDALLRAHLDGQSSARSTVRFNELFDRLVRFRNRELGHGATGQQTSDVYTRLSRAMLAGVAEILGKLDVLAGQRLLYIADVRQVQGIWLVERYELVGENPRRISSLEVSRTDVTRLPDAHAAYLERRSMLLVGDVQSERTPENRGSLESLCLLEPLVLYDFDGEETYFLNSRRGRRRSEYLSYTSGETVDRPHLSGEQRELLARVLDMDVDAELVNDWIARSQAEDPADDTPSEVGSRTLGDFELISRIGRGGMGVVYRSWQPSLGRQVALKCLIRSGDPKAEARFAREIRALGQVEHPNLVKILTAGSEGDQWFYAMELIEGADVANVVELLSGGSASEVGGEQWQHAVSTAVDRVRSQEETLGDDQSSDDSLGNAAETTRPRSLPQSLGGGAPAHTARSHITQSVELVRQVAQAAHMLHEAGVVHRDIKPGNIMLTDDGMHAVLMDLGLAQLTDETEGRLTRTRQFVGTLRYASPEQILAVGTLDRRCDIYSLGATLWELVTLRPLFAATEEMPTPDLMLKIQSTDVERPSRHNPRVPRDLDAIVLKCLEKDRDRRYASAAELATDLDRFLSGEPVQARPIGQFQRTWRWARRNSLVAALLLIVFTTLLAGTIVSSSLAVVASRRARDAKENAARADVALKREQNALATSVEARDKAEHARIQAELQRKRAENALADAEEARRTEELAREDVERLNKQLEASSEEINEALQEAKRGIRNTSALSWLILLWRNSGAGKLDNIDTMSDILRQLNTGNEKQLLELNARLAANIRENAIQVDDANLYRSEFHQQYGDDYRMFDFDSMYVNLYARTPTNAIGELLDFLPHYLLYWDDSQLEALHHLIKALRAHDTPDIFARYGQSLTDEQRSQLAFCEKAVEFMLSRDRESDAFEAMISFEQFDDSLYPGRQRYLSAGTVYDGAAYGLREAYLNLAEWVQRHRQLGNDSFMKQSTLTRPSLRFNKFLIAFHSYLLAHRAALDDAFYTKAIRFCRLQPALDLGALDGVEFPVDDPDSVNKDFRTAFVEFWREKLPRQLNAGDYDGFTQSCGDIKSLAPHDYEAKRLTGVAASLQGDSRRALAIYKELQTDWPGYDYPHLYCGAQYERRGDNWEAINEYTHAILLNSKNTSALMARARCLAGLGLLKEALDDTTAVIDGYGDRKSALLLRGKLFCALGHPDEAEKDFSSLRYHYSRPDGSHDDLAWLLATCPIESVRDGERAVKEAEIACRESNNNSTNVDTLAAALAEAKQFDAAVKTQEAALKGWSGDDVEEGRMRLELYRKEHAYRMPLPAATDNGNVLRSRFADIQAEATKSLKDKPDEMLAITPERFKRDATPQDAITRRLSAPTEAITSHSNQGVEGIGNEELAEQLYDMLMRDIEPDLLSYNIPRLDEYYKDESEAEHRVRMDRYEKAYAKFDRAFNTFMQEVVDETAKERLTKLKKYLKDSSFETLDPKSELGKWVESCRSGYRTRDFDKKQWLIEALEALPGWSWYPD